MPLGVPSSADPPCCPILPPHNLINLFIEIASLKEKMSSREVMDNPQPERSRFRISPIKNRSSLIIKKTAKPLSSSAIQEKKSQSTKEEILRINSKLELIKSKCMKSPNKSGSKKTLQSQWDDEDNNFSDSVDIESTEEGTQYRAAVIHMLRSRYEDRPATVYFWYPKCCGIEQPANERVYPQARANLTYKIAGSEYRCIVNSLEFNGFQNSEGGSEWSIFFDISGTHQKTLQSMNRYQKMNHFPGCWQLGRKDYMWKNLNKQRRSFPDAYNFVPPTYIFPNDYDRFQMIRQNAERDKLWILKPTNAACGRGIKMVGKETKLKNKKNTLISEYIANPHLINSYKYDLRLYVLVTSYDPLRIYLFNDGLTRFATYSYTTKHKDISKRFIHLTNFSVNKHSKKFVKNSKSEQDGHGSKWSITALQKWYEANGLDSKALFSEIKDIIIKTCISSEPVMLDIHSKTQEKRNCSFEIYGFDILIDSKFKPWLMEVNVCPSLSSSSPMDRKIKHTLLTDTLNLIGLEYQSKKAQSIDKKKDKLRLLQPRQDKRYFSKNINNLEQLNISNCIQILAPEDWLVIFESMQEHDRKGNFQLIFPLRHNIDKFKSLFEFSRYNNHVLWKYLKSDEDFLSRLYA